MSLGKIIAGGIAFGPIGAIAMANSSTNKANSAQAAAANQFTEKQLKNRHQWEVEDLKKAGLNPIMSAGGTPSIGSSAMAQQKSLLEGSDLKDIYSSLHYKRTREEVRNMKKQGLYLSEQAKQSTSNTALNYKAVQKQNQEIANLRIQHKMLKEQYDQLEDKRQKSEVEEGVFKQLNEALSSTQGTARSIGTSIANRNKMQRKKRQLNEHFRNRRKYK
jgi:hypothetical protein